MKITLNVGENTPAYGMWMRAVMQIDAFTSLVHLGRPVSDVQKAEDEWQAALKAMKVGWVADSVGEGNQSGAAKRLLQEMFVCRLVDAFNCYLTEVLYGVLRGRPETLRSSEQIKIEEVLKFQNLDDFAHYIAENKVTQLGHSGFDAILKFVTERMGVEIEGIKDAEFVLDAVREVIAVRNILVHNGGKVNRLFLQKTGNTEVAVGDTFPIEAEKFQWWVKALVAMSTSIDEALIAKYGRSAFNQISEEGEFVVAERYYDLPADSTPE